MHTISTYPMKTEDANLKTIPALKSEFNCEVGLSDHTLGIGVAIASVALGATIIEKHFITDKRLGGVDSSFSADDKDMKLLVSDSNNAMKAVGNISLKLSN